jgi:uncharacterized protein (TIGR03382 family)
MLERRTICQTAPNRILRSLLFVSCVGLAACGDTITLSDDVDLTWDFAASVDGFDDDLHTPYVKGTHVTLFVNSSDEDQSFRGWTVHSRNPDVFRLDSRSDEPDLLMVDGTAVGEGTAELVVYDGDGDVVGRGHAEVLEPDRIELEAHGYLIMNRDDEAAVDDPRIITNGTATYLVRYFRGARELHGNGVLSVEAPLEVTAEARTSFLFEDREWLTLRTGSTAGTQTIRMLVDGVPIATRDVVVVPDDAVDEVAILAQSESHAEDGQWLVALAQAYDVEGRRVFGIDYHWEINGVEEIGEGDLYRYRYAEGLERQVTAMAAGHSDTVTIHSEGGFVDSSNDVGCAATSPSSGALLGVVAMLLLRRRRRAGGGAGQSAGASRTVAA